MQLLEPQSLNPSDVHCDIKSLRLFLGVGQKY